MKRQVLFFLSLSLLCSLCACKEPVNPDRPDNPQVPDKSEPWTFEISGLNQFPCPSAEFQSVCPVFSPDGTTAYFQTSGKNIVAVQVASGRIKWQTNDLGELTYPTVTSMTQPAVNPVTGEIYINCHVSKTETNMFLALDPATGRISKKLDGIGIFASNLSGPAVSADGRYVYIGTNGVTLRVVDTRTFKVVAYAASNKGFRHVLVEGDRCILIGNHNEACICWVNPDAAPGGLLRHSEFFKGDDYYTVPISYPCFAKDGKKIWVPSADANVFSGATPTQAFMTCIDLEASVIRNHPVAGAGYVWNVLSDSDGCFYVTASASSKNSGAFVRKYSPDFTEEMWTWTVPNCFVDWAGGLHRSMPALGDDGNLYIVSRENNSVYRIDCATGESAKAFCPPSDAFSNKAQTGVNICNGYLVSAFTGLRSGVIAVADMGVDAPKCWSTVVGDPCGSKCYETVWGLPDQLDDIDIPIGAQNAYLFDAKSNTDLRSEMLQYLVKAEGQVSGTPLADAFRSLKTSVEAKMGSEPFAWIDQVNSFVTENIAKYPSRVFDAVTDPEGDELARRLLLLLRDYPLHEVSLAHDVVPMESGQSDAFLSSIRKTQDGVIEKLLAWLDTPAPAPGVLELFKIYNMGYIARTANHCFGLDVMWWGTDEQMRSLCDHIEAVFVTHAHGDHFNLPLLTEMSGREGKGLFMTTRTLTMFTPKGVSDVFASDENNYRPIDCNGLAVSSAIGAQGDLPCQIWCVEADGFCLWASGDNGVRASFDAASANLPSPNLTMLSLAGASADFTAAARKARGGLTHDVAYVVSHENEVNHTIDGRVSYKFFYESIKTMADNEYRDSLLKYATLDYGEILTITK